MLEEFVRKIGRSKYKDLLVFKGGFIVSTLLGLDTRMTRDLDITCQTTIYTEEEIREIINKVIKTPMESFFIYEIISIQKAQADDFYSGYVVMLKALREKTSIKFKIDVSNNALIYPEALRENLKSLFEEKEIVLNTYPLENIIAEKFETTLDRGEFNSRMKDLMDIYLLTENNSYMIDEKTLAMSIIEVSKDRNTLHNLNDFYEILNSLSQSKIFNANFQTYTRQQYPSLNISLNDVFERFIKIYKIVVKETGI